MASYDFAETSCEDVNSDELAQDKVVWWDFVITELKFGSSFLIRWASTKC